MLNLGSFGSWIVLNEISIRGFSSAESQKAGFTRNFRPTIMGLSEIWNLVFNCEISAETVCKESWETGFCGLSCPNLPVLFLGFRKISEAFSFRWKGISILKKGCDEMFLCLDFQWVLSIARVHERYLCRKLT